MLLVGKLFGDLAHRIGFSPLIGQIVAGIVLGPMILNAVAQSQNLEDLSGLGILFMMFLMGLSVDFEKVMGENVYKASTISLIGGLLTFFTAMSITALLGFDMNAALLVGISFISTSTAIGFMVLIDLGDNHSNVFKTIISVGTTDDILAMLALSLFVSYMATGVDIESAFKLFLVVLGFIILVLWFGRSISEKLISVAKNSANEMSAIMMSMIILFVVAYMGEQVSAGLQVTGAFLAGTILARSQVSYKYITPKIEAISEGLFIPIFFVYTGACVNIFGMINSAPIDFIILKIPVDFVLLLGLLLVVMASKYVGTYLSGVLMGGYTDNEMHKMGLAMTPMGEYTLVISQLGLVITDHGRHIPGAVEIYSVLAMVVLVTSILSPIMLRKAYERNY